MFFVYFTYYIFAFPGFNEKNELSSEVGIVGHRVTYSNGVEPHERMTRPPSSSVKPSGPESVRALKLGKGSSGITPNGTELILTGWWSVIT